MSLPTCPFCGASWTEAMLAQFDSMSHPSGCACCFRDEPLPERRWVAEQVGDLCCDECGRAIYLRPKPVS
jgi:hypothetical protein